MPLSKRVARWLAACVLIAAVAVTSGVATAYSISRASGSASSGNMWRKVTWRASVYARKAKGALPDLSWDELWQMTRHQGGFGLEDVLHGSTVEGALHNPLTTDKDHQAGSQIFRQRCAACHGNDGSGWHAPALNRAELRHGDSDLAIYKVIRDGITGTAMVPVTMTMMERWQVVGFIRTLQLRSSHNGVGGRSRLSGEDAPSINVSPAQILAAGKKTDEWLTYSGSLDSHRYSPLSEISTANVSQLKVRWVRQFDSPESVFEATPLVVNGVMFTTIPPSSAAAVDARTGEVLWRYQRDVPDDVPVCCGRVNRGMAILGNDLFLGTLDGYLVSLDANTGEVNWQIQVADWSEGYSITGAPLIVRDSLVIGVSGGEFGIRGFLVAYDPKTGKERWRFNTIPKPGEPGHETWGNDAWKSGGGPTWITGSYDPDLDLLYWGVGNPSPDFAGAVRPGDNLYSDSVVALHASTGQLAWHFQFTPHDDHDWDSNQTPILAELMISGEPRKVICWTNRNGFYYVLDRATGKFLVGAPFVELNWAKGLDRNGRPIPAEFREASETGRLTRPGVGGATNWQNPAYDERKGLVYVHAVESSSVFTAAGTVERGVRGAFLGSAGSVAEPPIPYIRALDASTGVKKWEHLSAPPLTEWGYSGLLATGGNLVFGAAGGSAFALDSSTGQEKWRVTLGGETRAAPITFTLDGKQVIAITSGHALFLFGL